jgi:Ras-related protein Rab-32
LVKEGLVNNAQQMDDFCRDKGFVKWFEVSAKKNINIEASFQFLIGEVKSSFYFGFNSKILFL